MEGMRTMPTETLPRWDLSNIYPSLESEEYGQASKQFALLLDELDGYLATHSISRDPPHLEGASDAAAIIDCYLTRMNAALELGRTLRSFVYSFVSTDSYNTTARRLLSELDPQFVRLEQQEMLFRGWIGALAADQASFQSTLDQPGPVHEHAFHLQESAETSRFLMSVAEETLAAELSLSGARAWEKLQEVVTSQLKVAFEQDGGVEEKPITVVKNLRTHPDEALRQRAYGRPGGQALPLDRSSVLHHRPVQHLFSPLGRPDPARL